MLLIPIEVLGDRFEKEHPSDEFDKVAWKNFFNRNAKYKTLCLSCIQQDQETEKQKAARLQRGAVEDAERTFKRPVLVRGVDLFLRGDRRSGGQKRNSDENYAHHVRLHLSYSAGAGVAAGSGRGFPRSPWIESAMEAGRGLGVSIRPTMGRISRK